MQFKIWKNFFFNFYDPLLPNSNYSYRIIKISVLKKDGIMEKIVMSAASMRRLRVGRRWAPRLWDVSESVGGKGRVCESVNDERRVCCL